MKLFIPKIGTRLVLKSDWKFKLHDERRNENFWHSLHGEPAKKIYYYGYSYYGYSGGYHTSPTPTATAKDQGKGPADPIDTVVPKGTVLFVESFHIQKGHIPSIALRIKKGNPTKISTGKFTADIEDINQMEVDSEFVEKYPHGCFTIRVGTGVDREAYKCKCHQWPCACGFPPYTDHTISWEADPDASRHNRRRAGVVHRTDTAGLDETKPGGFSYYSRQSDYTKHFDNIQECLLWAGKKCFTKSHIDAFVKAYEPERLAWEQSKA